MTTETMTIAALLDKARSERLLLAMQSGVVVTPDQLASDLDRFGPADVLAERVLVVRTGSYRYTVHETKGAHTERDPLWWLAREE
jgi:hypothetical protein